MAGRISFCLLSFMLFFTLFLQAEISDPVDISIFTEQRVVEPTRPIWLALRFNMEKDWHIYWKNPGAAGAPPVIEWKLPDGFKVAETLWPAPKKFVSESIVSYGYDKSATLLIKLIPPPNLPADLNVGCDVSWISCNESNCLPQSKHLVKNLNEKAASSLDIAAIFAEARTKMARDPDSSLIGREGGLFFISIDSKEALDSAEFIPEEPGQAGETASLRLLEKAGDINRYRVTFTARDNSRGVLAVRGQKVSEYYRIDPNFFKENVTEGALLPYILLLAFLGGLILNLMPCVLPVISLKILSFIKMSGNSAGPVLRHALFFTFGVLLSFWVLAAILLLLKSWGHLVGWGFQLQEPLFVAFLTALFFVLALSLFGVFELGTTFASKAGQITLNRAPGGLSASFFSGVLATAVATPCSGPFLGYAIGLAFTIPSWQAIMVFTAVALGMATPYLLIGLFPSLLRYLPKPGSWMITFKEIMGFFMLATSLWLLWVFAAQTDSQSLINLLFALLLLAIACWILGKWVTPLNTRKTRYISLVAAFAFLVAGGFVIKETYQEAPPQSFDEQIAMLEEMETRTTGWEKFSPQRIAELRQQGVPVFVDFTAKWCLLCQKNHSVLMNKRVIEKFRERGIVLMRADWTKKDDLITQKLREFNRSSVPLYLLYGADPRTKPAILPQILTVNNVINAINGCAKIKN